MSYAVWTKLCCGWYMVTSGVELLCKSLSSSYLLPNTRAAEALAKRVGTWLEDPGLQGAWHGARLWRTQARCVSYVMCLLWQQDVSPVAAGSSCSSSSPPLQSGSRMLPLSACFRLEGCRAAPGRASLPHAGCVHGCRHFYRKLCSRLRKHGDRTPWRFVCSHAFHHACLWVTHKAPRLSQSAHTCR